VTVSHGRLRRSGVSRLGPVLACLALIPLLAACGSSSKPSYCSHVSDLQQSVKDLANVKPIQNGTKSVTDALNKVKDNAQATVDAAKKDFPSETSAVSSAVSNLASAVRQLPSATASTLAALPGQIQAASTAVTDLANATNSKCG
jgi:hypothetical protein